MPYKDPEAKRLADKKRRATEAYKAAERERWAVSPRRKELKPFIGVDGEGGTINGKHEYLLLRVGENLLYHNSKPLRTVDILRWLTSLPDTGIYVGYGFDYDVSMILKDWSKTPAGQTALRQLFDREGRTGENGGLYPVGFQGFLVEYLPRKHFKVARWAGPDEKRKWFTVHDTLGFYQSSFVQALEAWDIGTPEERKAIADMKQQRQDFTEATEREIEYNHRECIMLAELTELLRDSARDIGISAAPYEGAGCLAQSMLTKNKAPARNDNLPEKLQMAARWAYYGGWFETNRIGYIKPAHEYDLASAYPWAMSRLPCLEHGIWVNEYQPGNPMQVLKVEWAISSKRTWGPYPFRDPDGAILHPSSGQGWYWYPEVAVEDRARETNDVLDAWSFVSACNHKPFSWIGKVFAERLRLGKGSRGKVLKLGTNSLYGKLAQSVGNPRFASAIYAGYITSQVRAVMADVCLRYGNKVAMIATDGIYLTEPMKPYKGRIIVEAGETPQLGCWEHTEFESLFLVKPGIYFTPDGTKVKTRGIPRWQMNERKADIVAAWENDGISGAVTIERTQFIGARAAIAQNAPERVGQWLPQSVTLRYESNMTKRNFSDDGSSTLWSRQGRITTPYNKAFGVELQDEMLWEDLDVLQVED